MLSGAPWGLAVAETITPVVGESHARGVKVMNHHRLEACGVEVFVAEFRFLHGEIRGSNTDVDLELFRVLDAILEARSVTGAADKLGVSQSAVSQRLRRIREELGDPLVVPTRGRLVLTDRARRMEAPLRRALGDLQRSIQDGESFDPASSQRTFRFAAGDYGEMILASNLLSLFEVEAPGIKLATEPRLDRIADRLESGALDFAVTGPGVSLPEGLKQRALPPEVFVVLARSDHVIRRMTRKAYLRARHVVVAPGGGSHTVVDENLSLLGFERKVVLRLAYFLTAPFVVAQSDLLLTAPSLLAVSVLDYLPLKVMPMPFSMPELRAVLVWHPRSHSDPGHTWLRRRIVAGAVQMTADAATKLRPRRAL